MYATRLLGTYRIAFLGIVCLKAQIKPSLFQKLTFYNLQAAGMEIGPTETANLCVLNETHKRKGRSCL